MNFARYTNLNRGVKLNMPRACVCCLYTTGRKHLTAVWIETAGKKLSVSAHKMPLDEERHMRPVEDNYAAKYTPEQRVQKAARFMLRAGKRGSITKAARELLEAAA